MIYKACGRLAFFAARLPCLWFAFLPPSPLPPFPVGRGRFFCFLMQGASPLASPAFNRLRHLQNLPNRCPAGGLSPALPSRQALAVPCGGACLLCRPPTLPLVCCFAPYPPNPLPRRGRGRFFSLFRRGLRPRHPCTKPFAALIVPAAMVPGGGLVPGIAVSAGVSGTLWGACPLCRPPTLPLVCCFAPYPPNPLPRRGRGRFFCFLMQGASPPAPLH